MSNRIVPKKRKSKAKTKKAASATDVVVKDAETAEATSTESDNGTSPTSSTPTNGSNGSATPGFSVQLSESESAKAVLGWQKAREARRQLGDLVADFEQKKFRLLKEAEQAWGMYQTGLKEIVLRKGGMTEDGEEHWNFDPETRILTRKA